jgi:protein TonB
MKRNENMVPEFDEIIFKNRNKSYGAYDLRKRYKSATSISILSGIAFSVILMTALSFSTEEGKASADPETVIIIISEPLLQEPVTPPEVKPPAVSEPVAKYQVPEVTNDSTQVTVDIPITDDLIRTTINGDLNDTMRVIEPTDPILPAEDKIFIAVEESPEYPGGIPELMNYISQNLKYPSEAVLNNIQGKVILKFVVNADGSVDRVELLRSIDPLLDNEAIRVVSSLPRFKPGKQGGVPVRVWFSIPFSFKLRDN